MTEETKPTVTIDDKEYIIEDLRDGQKRTLNHVADLNSKILNSNFQLEQLKAAQHAMKNILSQSLAEPIEEAQAAADTAKADSEK